MRDIKFMNWNTIYIRGEENFWDDVNKKLSQSDLAYLPGYIEQLENGQYQALYWIGTDIELRKVKEAITGKIVWKYRLNFFNEIEEPNYNDIDEVVKLTSKEKKLLRSMRAGRGKPKLFAA